MFSDFSTQSHGKWILAGEHAVVRGHPALVFPLLDKALQLQYRADGAALRVELSPANPEAEEQIRRVLAHGATLVGQTFAAINGHFLIDSNIPMGQGLGASAALCVALSRWFIAQGWQVPEAEFEFARQLEDLFHGQSSGLDIVGTAAETGMLFQKGAYQPIELAWQPHFQWTATSRIGSTATCIAQVKALWSDDPNAAERIDLQMRDAVLLAKEALSEAGERQLIQLQEAIRLAGDCFQRWGLVDAALEADMNRLLAAGALAVKPTGSGGGGYLLSLWPS